MYSHDHSTYFPAAEYADWSWEYVYRTQKQVGRNWDCGRGSSFSRNRSFEFSVYYLCSEHRDKGIRERKGRCALSKFADGGRGGRGGGWTSFNDAKKCGLIYFTLFRETVSRAFFLWGGKYFFFIFLYFIRNEVYVSHVANRKCTMRNSEKSLVNMLLSAVSRNRKRGKLTSSKSVQFTKFPRISVIISVDKLSPWRQQLASIRTTGCRPPSPFPLSPWRQVEIIWASKLPPSSPLGYASDGHWPKLINLGSSSSDLAPICWTNSGGPLVNSLLWDWNWPISETARSRIAVKTAVNSDSSPFPSA